MLGTIFMFQGQVCVGYKSAEGHMGVGDIWVLVGDKWVLGMSECQVQESVRDFNPVGRVDRALIFL